MAVNKEWHEKNRMPKRAGRAARVAWHVEHAARCGCRPVPVSLWAEVEERLAARSKARKRKAQEA
jgi:hypothetical protein